MCGRGDHSKPIEWDETSDEALSSFPLMMMRKRWKLLFSTLNQDPADCPEMSVYDQCWHDTCISWNTWTCIFVRNQDIVADGPLSTFGFWTPYCSWNPDWRLMFGIRTSDSYLFGTFLLYCSMMWKYFYYRHDQGWVRSLNAQSRLCSDWSRRQLNQNQLKIPARERPNEDKMRFHNSNHKTTCIFSKTSQMHIKLIHFLYIQ